MKRKIAALCLSMICLVSMSIIGKAKVKETIYMKKGDTYSIQLKGSYSFSSKNTKKISVSKKGKISAKKVGTGIVTARKGKKKYKYKVVVLKTMKIMGKSRCYLYKKTNQLSFPVKGSKVKWTSSDPKIATVDETGLVTMKGYGKCVISVKYLGKEYRHPITIQGFQGPIENPAD